MLNFNEIKNRYLGKKVRIVAEGKYFHREGKVEAVKEGFFPALVIMFNGAPKYFHITEVLLLS